MKTVESQTEDLPQDADLERARLASALEQTSRLLHERVKELDCIHALSQLFDLREASVEETLRAIVAVIPRAWQYPDVAEARITLGDAVFQTGGFRDTPWQHSSRIVVRDAPVGTLAVCYLAERPTSDDGPFLAEERNLLGTIAQRISSFVERRWTLENLLSYQEELRELASALASSEQRERRRIAQGLHDHIGQNLALVNMRLSAAQQADDLSVAARAIAEAREILSDVISETRTLTFELCPPILYELGLAAALDWLAEQFEATYGFSAIVREHGTGATLPEDVSAALFQAVRELLTNTGRHAGATTVNVHVYNDDDRVRVVVEDNGVGFDAAALESRAEPYRGFGLFSIRERLRFMGGGLEIESGPGCGTVVRLTVPRSAVSDGERGAS